jgi:hypothetical protein
MVRTVFVALTGKEPDFKIMSRNILKLWRDVVARHRIAAWVDLARGGPLVFCADGSERKNKNLYGLYLVAFDPIEWKHFVVDLLTHCEMSGHCLISPGVGPHQSPGLWEVQRRSIHAQVHFLRPLIHVDSGH